MSAHKSKSQFVAQCRRRPICDLCLSVEPRLQPLWSLLQPLWSLEYSLCGVSTTAFVESLLQPLWSRDYSLCGVATTAFVESLLQPAPSQFSAACCGRQGREGCRGDPWCRLCMIDLHLSSKCESPFPLSGPHPSAFPHHSQSHAHTHTHTHARTHARTHTHIHTTSARAYTHTHTCNGPI